MKTTYLKITASLLLLASLTVSCDGCNDKKTTHSTSDDVKVTVETTDGNSAYDEASGDNANGAESSGVRQGSSTAKPTVTNTAKGTKKGNDGYSAPDGTDAENHDGDMYTKHDTTQRPSGPPIK